MNQQDLVWVKVFFSNLKEAKVRPAVIVSNNNYNRENQDVIICAVTSKQKESIYSISIDNKDLSTGALLIKSVVRADKILQIEKNLIIRPFAKLNNIAFDKLIDKIIKLINRSN